MSLTINLGDLPLLLDETSADLTLPPVSDAEFLAFCERNPLLHVERTAKGMLHFMPPVTAWDDSRCLIFAVELENWNYSLPTPGLTFGPTAGFRLPNGAIRAPDASWMPHERWDALPDEAKYPYPHLCPDFVVEIMSPTDRLSVLQEKMQEYRTNGARLDWLIDCKNSTVYVYRTGADAPEIRTDSATVSGDPGLPDFAPDLSRVFA
jgi:Uma2 family endonuclease